MDEKKALELARAVAPDCDPQVELDIPPNVKVRFIGEPIWALNQETNNLTVPARFLNHGLVEDRFFFTLPELLWEGIVDRVGEDAFGDETMELERILSSICGDHFLNVGFWKGRAFPYNLLQRPLKYKLSVEKAHSVGWEVNQAQLDNIMRLYKERTSGFAKVACAYAGWLLTNRVFLYEHDDLFTQWSDMVGRWGLGQLGIVLPKGDFLLGDDPTSDSRWPDYSAAFEEFFVRWRLQGLAAPYLPVPLQPLMGGAFPVSIVPQVIRAGGAFCFPDTFPVPSRDDCRRLLEDALRSGNEPMHLKDWMALISGDNPAKTPLGKYKRLFGLQHYWRILRRRHPRAFRRRIGVFEEALAAFCGVSKDTIHRDLLFLTRHLGKDWIDRGGSFPFGPF